MARRLGTVIRLFAGMMTGLAFVALGILAYAVIFDLAPPAVRDPVARFDPAIVSPPQVTANPPAYQPVTDRLEQVGFFTIIAQTTLPALAGLTASTGSSIDSRAAPDIAGTPAAPSELDTPGPGPDQPFRSEEPSAPPPVLQLANIDGTLPIVRAELSVGPIAAPGRGGDAGPRGTEHYLQSGYFAYRENAVGLSEQLSNAGLGVLMEQTKNRAGKTRWRVLVGPYRQKKAALRARSKAPELLADAFYKRRDN